MRREILRDLKTDSFVGPGDQGDGFVLHGIPPLCDACPTATSGLVWLPALRFAIMSKWNTAPKTIIWNIAPFVKRGRRERHGD